MALSYHEVLADNEPMTPTAVRASDLARQFAWLQANDFHPVSVDQILAAVEHSDEELDTEKEPVWKWHHIFTREGPWLVDVAQ